MVKGTRVVGYVRVSTQDQAESGAGLRAQRTAIEAECERRGWVLVTILEDHVSAKSTKGRDGLDAAKAMIRAGAADALVVSKLDRLSRSVVDFGKLIAEAQDDKWAIVVLDMDLDMTTAAGRMVAGVLMNFAQYERELIGERTRDGLAAKRAAGIRLGRPVALSPKVAARIKRQRDLGDSLRTIAQALNDDGIPTAQGGAQWHASTVRSVLWRLKQGEQ